MGAFNTILTCTLGGGSAFQLESYDVAERAIVSAGGTRLGAAITATGGGYVEAADQAGLTAAIAAAMTSFRTSGRDFVVRGFGSAIEYQLLAAQCVGGGPHVDFKMGQATDALRRPFTFTITAATAEDPNADDGGGGGGGGGTTTTVGSYKTTVAYGADNLRTVSRAGEILTGDASVTFQSSVVPTFRAAYPLPGWVVGVQSDTDVTDGHVTYTLTARELATPLPTGGVLAVDGEAARRTERSGPRMTTTLQVDFKVAGDPYALQSIVRQAFVGQQDVPVSESWEVTTHQEVRLRGTVVLLGSAENDGMLEYKQDVRELMNPQLWEEMNFPGAEPILANLPKRLRRVEQSGRAVGKGAFPVEVAPIYDTLLEAPEVKWERDVDGQQFVVTWRYLMAVDRADAGGGYGKDFNAGNLARPQGMAFR